MEELRETVLLKCLPHFPDLTESVRFDFEFDRVLRCVLNQRVTRIELENAGNVANPYNHRAAEAVGLAITQKRAHSLQHSALTFWFERRLGQDDVSLEVLGDIICHDLKRTFRLGLVERQAELVK